MLENQTDPLPPQYTIGPLMHHEAIEFLATLWEQVKPYISDETIPSQYIPANPVILKRLIQLAIDLRLQLSTEDQEALAIKLKAADKAKNPDLVVWDYLLKRYTWNN